jgi:hypothetical protein
MKMNVSPARGKTPDFIGDLAEILFANMMIIA